MATGRIPTTANSPLTAKGDLFTFSTGSAKLAVGNNGESLVADSSATTGLRWQGDYAAGKNKVLNADMNIWQRGTTFTSPASGTFTADRFKYLKDGTGTCTVSQQTFTPGAAPVAGYESAFFLRNAGTALGTSTNFDIQQNIEDVRTLAGQTVTISFYAKADSARTLTLYVGQDFGSGGSATAYPLGGQTYTLTTSWARYSTTFTMTSISGKTIGTNSFVFLLFRNAASASLVFDLWGVQLEAGSTATAFQTATGTIQGELAACQRYYFRASVTSQPLGSGVYYAATTALIAIKLPVTMRVSPTYGSSGVDALSIYSNSARASTANTLDVASPDAITVIGTTASSTLGYGAVCYLNGASKYLEAIAEL